MSVKHRECMPDLWLPSYLQNVCAIDGYEIILLVDRCPVWIPKL